MTKEHNEVPCATPDFATEAASQLAELFPEIIADGKINLDTLKTILDTDLDEGHERFGLTWPGKREAIRAAQTPTTATLMPDKQNSVNWDTTQNVFIEGDNLEVLKILQKHYYGKIKMIYIDPPYNTGKDFVYSDNYADSIGNYLDITGQSDDTGKLSTNSESDGRFHSNWLNMMYPRLKLARNLLDKDGFIFISIDDKEVSHLQQVCTEIFGEHNYVACAPRKTGAGSAATRSDAALRKLNDFILIYSRTPNACFKKKVIGTKEYPLNDEFGDFRLAQFQASGSDATRTARPNMWYRIYVTPDGTLSLHNSPGSSILIPEQINGEDGRWLWSPEKFASDATRYLYFDGNRIHRKIYYDPSEDQSITQVERAWFEGFTNADGTREIDQIFGVKKVFSHPKPTSLLKHLLEMIPSSDGIILDFFGGSGSTAHAVMALNAEDGGTRRYITVQLPEPTPSDSIAYREGFSTISQISRSRLMRAGEEIFSQEAAKRDGRSEALDIGFRAYTLTDTNFLKWKANSGLSEGELVDLFNSMSDSANDDARPEALLAEVLLKLGLSLSESIETIDVEGLEVFSVSDGLVMAYLDEHTTPTLTQLRALVAKEPERLVILEDTFKGNDELKTNLVQECRTHNVDLWTA